MRFLAAFLLLFSFLCASGCKGKEAPSSGTAQPGLEQAERAGASPAAGASGTAGTQDEGTQSGASNTPPRITTINVVPDKPVRGDKLKVQTEVFDRDADEVTLAYQWSLNDDSLDETSDTLTITNEFRHGDKVTVRVTPRDGKSTGTPVTMYATVANSSPVINPSQDFLRFDGSTYSYKVAATDPDGDPLTYSLKNGPQGMKVNQSTGQITWNLPQNFKGSVPVTVSVSDGQGGEVLQSFNLEISPDLKR